MKQKTIKNIIDKQKDENVALTSEKFQKQMMDKVLEGVGDMMPKVLDDSLPKMTGPSIPKEFPKL